MKEGGDIKVRWYTANGTMRARQAWKPALKRNHHKLEPFEDWTNVAEIRCIGFKRHQGHDGENFMLMDDDIIRDISKFFPRV